jgi:TetR/AcrR family transcriptional regulator
MPALDATSQNPGTIRQSTEALILAAAEQVFARRGYEGTRMTEIAAAAGLPKANLHYYFGTKERLYRTVLETILGDWLSAAAEWIVPDRAPAEALTGYIAAKMAHARRRPQASRIFASELLRGAPHIMSFLSDDLRRRVAEMSTTIAHWAATRRMDPIAPAHLLYCIWAMTQTYADFDVQIRATLGTSEVSDTEFATATATVTALILKGCGLRAA